MTRSSTKELFTPFKYLKQEFRSSRKHFKTLSLDKQRSPEFGLFSDQEEYSKGEVVKKKAETLEQYMIKTRADNGSRIARPKIEDKDSFELKGQFLKELHDNTFSSSDHEEVNKHIEKVLEIEIVLFYNGSDVPTRQIPDSRGAIPSKTTVDAKDANNVKVPITPKIAHSNKKGEPLKKLTILNLVHLFKEGDIEQSMEETLSEFMIESTKRHKENSNLIKGIQASTDAWYSLVSHRTVKYPKGIAENLLVGIGKFIFLIDFIILDMPEDIKVPLILERPFLSTACAKIDIFKRNITLRVGEENIIFKSVKPVSNLIKRVYMLSLRERMELDLEARLI
nr:hypothetical protein [Tanacetum cinerariifolium]